jgi:hypothetical protein
MTVPNVFTVPWSIADQEELFEGVRFPFHVERLLQATLHILGGITASLSFLSRDELGACNEVVTKFKNLESGSIFDITIAYEGHTYIEPSMIILHVLNDASKGVL